MKVKIEGEPGEFLTGQIGEILSYDKNTKEFSVIITINEHPYVFNFLSEALTIIENDEHKNVETYCDDFIHINRESCMPKKPLNLCGGNETYYRSK